MNGGPSGFSNAQVTRALVISCFAFSAFFGTRGSPSHIGLAYQDLFSRPRLWKIVASMFTFSSTPELICGLYLLYYFRVFERQIGSNKYSVFICFSMIISVILEGFALAYFKDSTVGFLAPGPYGLIFASFVPFFFDIPVSTIFKVFGARFSDKAFIYLAGFQLFISSWRRSMLPGLCGILSGFLYRLNLLGIQKVKFPEFVYSFLSRLSWSLGGSPRGRNAAGSSVSYPRRAMERTTPTPTPPSVEPQDGAIATLVAMGFDSSAAREALVHARNDISVATNILLEAQSHQ